MNATNTNHKTKGTATIKPNTTCLFSQNSMSEVTRSGCKLAWLHANFPYTLFKNIHNKI